MQKKAQSTQSIDVTEALRKTVRKHNMIGSDDQILVGVSGGADSVCLALILKDRGYRIGIAHVNHGLRGDDSDEDERFSAMLAQKLEVPYFSRRVLLISGNVEAAGRAARRDFFDEVAHKSGF